MAARPGLERIAAAIIAQGLTSGVSVIVQVFAARDLGAAGYGSFTIINGVLLTVLAFQNGWVGDSLTVLERFDPVVRAALTVSQLVFAVLGGLACFAVVLIMSLGSAQVGLCFAVMAVVYLMGELCRRIFMARREFWALSANNLIFCVATYVALLAEGFITHRHTLSSLALAVAMGSAVAILAACVQLPLRELRPGRLNVRGFTSLSRFAIWRSGQIGLRPLEQLIMRLIVSGVAGRAALGRLQAAYLLVSPATTFTQGAGSFLLPTYAAEARGEKQGKHHMLLITGGIVIANLGLCAIPLVLPGLSQRLLTNGSFKIPTSAVLAWGFFCLAFAIGLPSANRAVARKMSLEVFRARILDCTVGVAAVCVLVAAGKPLLSAYGLGIGALVGAYITIRLNRPMTTTPAAAPVDPVQTMEAAR